MKPERMAEIRSGVERLIQNIAAQDKISIARAAYLVRNVAVAYPTGGK